MAKQVKNTTAKGDAFEDRVFKIFLFGGIFLGFNWYMYI